MIWCMERCWELTRYYYGYLNLHLIKYCITFGATITERNLPCPFVGAVTKDAILWHSKQLQAK